MENAYKDNVRSLIKEHLERYPMMQIDDLFKLLYHSAFGCEHAVASLELAEKYLLSESETKIADSEILVESLASDYSRVHLSYLNDGLSVKTLAVLFFLSSKKEEAGIDRLISGIDTLRNMVIDGEVSISLSELEDSVEKWKDAGYHALHHSQIYRQHYNPSYRVISNKYVRLLSVFASIDKAISEGKDFDPSKFDEEVSEVYGVRGCSE